MGPGPVLLVGAGRGEATCGILYLAGYLRRHGVEAYVRLYDGDQTEEDLQRTLKALVSHVKPAVVGISLKWYLHVHRAFVIARAVRKADPRIRIVLGGNSAALWWRELLAADCFDDVVLGDGEVPFLALCRGVAEPPNVARRGRDGVPVKAPFEYVQTAASADVYYSHFDDIFLSQLDLGGFSGWVAPGKGCDQSCVYCGGRRAAQRLSFGRPSPFLRPPEPVRQDHREIDRHVWQYRYDFPGGSTTYLCDVWPGLELKHRATTYFLWGVPEPELVRQLSERFERVALILDIGCFGESQRLELMAKGLLKPCPTDDALARAIDDCLRAPNLELEVCGIAGLPFATPASLAEERALMERVLRRGCKVGYQRLQSQPGALVTAHPERFGMHSDAVTYDDFLAWFSRRGSARKGIPMVTFRDAALEKAVQHNCAQLDATIEGFAVKRAPKVTGRTRVKATLLGRREVPLGDWLGRYKVPAKAQGVPVTVLRSYTGLGLAVAPSLDPRAFDDPMVESGANAAAVLEALEVCARPVTLDEATGRLARAQGLDPESAGALLEHLREQRFISLV
ncbi:MAG: cobalamin-dependent protein [Myxococcaceae bacterium]|jgi:hypothetical protein|nr:cobalamin-dependent protein [Myxococcaceae bacterium]MCA3011231.1 cobalamin-dependent protein [Myxococcaceae bacterium]